MKSQNDHLNFPFNNMARDLGGISDLKVLAIESSMVYDFGT